MPGVGVQPGCSAEGERLLPLSHPSGGAGWQSPSCTSPTCLHLPCCAAGPGSSSPSSLCVPRNTGHALGSSDPPSLPRNTGHAPGSSNPLPKDTVHGLRSSDPSSLRVPRNTVHGPDSSDPSSPLVPMPLSIAGPPCSPPSPGAGRAPRVPPPPAGPEALGAAEAPPRLSPSLPAGSDHLPSVPSGTQGGFPRQTDAFAFEEDSSNDGLSPERPRSRGSPGPAEPPPGSKAPEPPPAAPAGAPQVRRALLEPGGCGGTGDTRGAGMARVTRPRRGFLPCARHWRCRTSSAVPGSGRSL